MAEAHGAPTLWRGLGQYVTLRGGDYFFVPGRDSLVSMAGWER